VLFWSVLEQHLALPRRSGPAASRAPVAAGVMANHSIRTVQAHAVLKQLGAILEAGGASYANVVRTTVLLTDMGKFQKVSARQ